MTDNTNATMLAMQKEHGPLLEVRNLAIDFTTDTGKPVHAVRDANFTVYPGQWVAIVGESGSGKSTSAMAVLGLLPGTGHVVNGSIKLDGEEIAGAKQSEFDKLRGTKMGLVPQDPMSNLNPVWRIATRARQFPHEFSGGMRQRALIAIGLACRPDLLIADEPTSALDVTVQKRILDHLHMLTDSLGTAVLFITHDLGLAAERAQRIVVMYKGQVVESGPSLEVLQHPQHPYTKRLVAAAPSLASQRIISAKERGENADALLGHHIAGESTLEKSEHIITVDHLTKEFKLPRPMYSIFRSIEEPLRIHKIGDKKSRANRVKELLDMVEMPASVMGRYPNELSGGQRQRIAIARAMALDPDVIVCDEAVSALDVLVQDQVLRLLNDLQAEKGLSYLFITHDLAVVRQIADEVVVMQHGKLVEHATTDEVFDHPQKQYTRDLLDAIPGGKLQLGLD